MARYERNRGMLFGSWTGDSILLPSVEVDTLTVSARLSVTCNASTFANQVKSSDEYCFYYVGNGDYGLTSGHITYLNTHDVWELRDTKVFLADYGIALEDVDAYHSDKLQIGDMINIVYTKAGSGWEPLGKDNDSLVKEMNPDSEKIKNILGHSVVRLNGYESEISLDPYYIDPSSKMYKRLLHNAIAERNDESHIKGKIAEAFFTTANKQLRKMKGFCFIRDAWYIPQSTGGDTVAFGIPVTITPIGASTYGTIVYDMESHEATITNSTIPENF